MTLARKKCEAHQLNFSEVFRYQFVITKGSSRIDGLENHIFDDFVISVGKDLQCFSLYDAQSRQIGYLLGIAVNKDEKHVDKFLFKNLDSTSSAFWHEVENELDYLSGRYALILSSGNEVRFYGDATGSLGGVIDCANQRFASSPFLIMDEEAEAHPLYPDDVVPNGQGSYRFLHTIDPDIQRLNPNFYLELKSYRSERFWPRENHYFDAPEITALEIYSELNELSCSYIKGLVENYRTAMPITGGYDSRIILAAAGVHREKVTQYFAHINNYANRRDAFIGDVVCKQLGLKFEKHDRKQHRKLEEAAKGADIIYQIAAGTDAGAPQEIKNGINQLVEKDSVVLRGHQTNILRGQYVLHSKKAKWDRPIWQIKNMAVVEKKKGFNADVTERFLPDYNSLRESFPENAYERRVDFLFLEGLVCNALGELFTGMTHAFYMSPWNSRRIIELCMRLDTELRLSKMPTHEFIEFCEPKLSDVPYISEVPGDLNDFYNQDQTEKRVDKVRARMADLMREHSKA